MKKAQLKIVLFLFLVNAQVNNSYSQDYSVYDDATELANNCFQLTSNASNQQGAVWANAQLNLNNPLNIAFEINCGNDEWGADGMAFVLQDNGVNTIGVGGGRLGIGNIVPSLCVEIDVWQNNGGPPDDYFDIASDHLAISKDGNVDHSNPLNLFGPVSADPGNANIEDGNDHLVSISWNPIEQVFRVWFDCNLRMEYPIDISNEIFGGNNLVYWGITGSTGGATATFQTCIIENTQDYSSTTELCLNASSVLTLSENPIGPVSWSPDTELDDSGLTNPTTSATSNTLYTASYTGTCGSLVTEQVQVNVTELSVDASTNETMICADPEINIDAMSSWPGSNYTWTTVNGNISSGQNSATVSVDQTGNYIVTASGMGGMCIDTAEVFVELIISPLLVDAGEDIILDCNTEANLLGSSIGGEAPLTTVWTLGNGVLGNNPALDILSLDNMILTYTVTDQCNQVVSDEVEITVNIIPVDITIPTSITGNCLDEFVIEVESNYPQDLELTWSDNAVQETGDFSYSYQSFESTELMLTAEGSCGAFEIESVFIVIQNEPLLFAMPNDTAICLGEGIEINPVISGGVGQLTYSWIGTDSFQSSVSVYPENPTTYFLEVADQCLQSASGDVFVDVQNIETEIVSDNLGAGLFQLSNIIEPACEDCLIHWDFNPFGESEEAIVEVNLNGVGSMSVLLTVTNPIGCLAYAETELLAPPVIYIPNSFTPDNDGINDTFFVVASNLDDYEILIFNRWGDVVFQSNDHQAHWLGDDLKNGYYVPNGMYTWMVNYTGFNTEALSISGSVMVVR